MIKVIKRMFVASICTFSLLMVAAIPVLAINVEPAAIEEITWKKVCSLETYGSVTVTLKLNYNATTQTSTLKNKSLQLSACQKLLNTPFSLITFSILSIIYLFLIFFIKLLVDYSILSFFTNIFFI